MARKFLYVCSGMFMLTLSYFATPPPATAQASGRLVGTVMVGGCAVAVTEGGDLFASSYLPGGNTTQQPWTFVDNLFAAAGSSPISPVVGLTEGGLSAVCRNGDYYYVVVCGSGATFAGNIFAEAGRIVPGAEICTVGWGAGSNTNHFFVGASDGGVYRKSFTGSLWEYTGSIPTAPTTAKVRTWGEVKGFYR
jgi:hypothetical protein